SCGSKSGFVAPKHPISNRSNVMRIAVAASLCLTAALTFAPSLARAQDMGIEVGSKAPAAAVETLDGKPADLSQFIGKTPVLIEFWATWCPNCKELEPHLK